MQYSGKAYDYFVLGAEVGSDIALYGLGYCYQEGYIINKDECTSIEYYRQSAELGNANYLNFTNYIK